MPMNPTLADKLYADERVEQARRLLREAVGDYQRELVGVRAADPTRAEAYDEMIEHFAQLRGGALYFPYLGSGLGRGALVELADGSVKYDMIGGIGVHVCGHSHTAMIDATIDAAVRDTVMQGHLQQNTESAALCRRLVELAGEGGAELQHCFLTTSGAMANENAMKIAFQKAHPADRLLAFEHCFAGRTMALAQLTDKPAYREGLPKTIAVDYVPFFDGDDAAGSTRRAVAVLQQHLRRYPKLHAAMWFELVLGEGGYYSGCRNFFAALMDVLKEHDVAIVVDEVQTFGRTTRPFAFAHFELDGYVDIVTIGKMTQVCATFFGQAFRPRRGLISQTFTGSTSSLFAAKAIIDALTSGGYFGDRGRIAQVHDRFASRLEAIGARQNGQVRGPYGLGGMIAMTVGDGSIDQAKQFLRLLYDAGVIAFLAGSAPARVRFLPPLIAITDEDIDTVLEITEQALIALGRQNDQVHAHHAPASRSND